MLLDFNSNNFNVGDGLAVVDFFSSWCGPCNRLAPIIEKLAEQNQDVIVGKVNTQENPALASKFGISAIPTIIFFKQGKIVKKIVGFQPLHSLQTTINQLK